LGIIVAGFAFENNSQRNKSRCHIGSFMIGEL